MLAMLACNGETIPTPANLAGTWNFTYATSGALSAGVTAPTCQSTMTFTISQTDQTFVGTQLNGGTLVCEGLTPKLPSANLAQNAVFTGEQIYSGVVSPNEVAFRLGTLNSQDAGVLQQSGLMTGTSTWTLPIEPNGTITVTGTWTAIKQLQ
jgi:hypothetical protein